ncbi:MAG TPA: Swt1 family HEPN domain-containing protein, partial [Pseudonocardiaceae bacterium]|nr:Swt1 family HEPN domain-containing protein [Pseudonocardiaceae bacterium]
MAGKPPKHHSATDLQAQLKMLTRRLGSMGFPFDVNKQTAGTLGRELTIVRNARAHGDPLTRLDAWRAHDFCVRLLEYFGDAEG